MIESLVISNVVLWVLLLGLAGVVLALTRQIGLLHERIAPVGALATQRGPDVGEPAPALSLRDESGETVALGEADPLGRRTLLFFLSPTCPVCDTLLPTLRRVAGEERGVRLLLASDGAPEEHAAFRRAHALRDEGYLLSTELGLRFEVAKLPYAVLIDAGGVVRAKGLVNTREHLESLFEADARGVASVQAWLEREERSAGVLS